MPKLPFEQRMKTHFVAQILLIYAGLTVFLKRDRLRRSDGRNGMLGVPEVG